MMNFLGYTLTTETLDYFTAPGSASPENVSRLLGEVLKIKPPRFERRRRSNGSLDHFEYPIPGIGVWGFRIRNGQTTVWKKD